MYGEWPVNDEYSKKNITNTEHEYCFVENSICGYFNAVKYLKNTIIERLQQKIDFYDIKNLCQAATEKMIKIEILFRVLHPEYDYSIIDDFSFNNFLINNSNIIKIYFVNIKQHKKDYLYFKIKPEKKY